MNTNIWDAYARLEERGYRSVERMRRPPTHLIGAVVCGAAFVYYTRHEGGGSEGGRSGFTGVDLFASSVFGFCMVGSFSLLYSRTDSPTPLKAASFLVVSILVADLVEQAVYRLLETASSHTDLSVYLQEKGIDLTPGERVFFGDVLGSCLASLLVMRLRNHE